MKFKDIRFGPAGLGGVDSAEDRLEYYSKKGLKACEIAFTYGVYIKNKEDAVRIGKKAKELDIKLSIHAPYWINLNSKEKKKIEESKKRILDCCKVGNWLGAYRIVFHPGYYSKMDKEETYQNIKIAIIDMQEERKKNKWKPELAPETTGKVNVFGSLDEIKRLAEDTKCSFTIDFAHILAREKTVDYEKIKKLFGKHKEWHCHFSGIEYGEKGERKHKRTRIEDWKKLISNLPKDKDIVIINESPYDVQDSVEGLSLV
ncbi:MAG: TIM barrel protein [Candidatus Nanoarchaeia archaeon]|nr:TIM barrel protein [Candidatus Nanoarchaeia archaeon]MDD5740679.1 TIM barrel protein [Candidatus Nanoarchaeia archaeon]